LSDLSHQVKPLVDDGDQAKMLVKTEISYFENEFLGRDMQPKDMIDFCEKDGIETAYLGELPDDVNLTNLFCRFGFAHFLREEYVLTSQKLSSAAESKADRRSLKLEQKVEEMPWLVKPHVTARTEYDPDARNLFVYGVRGGQLTGINVGIDSFQTKKKKGATCLYNKSVYGCDKFDISGSRKQQLEGFRELTRSLGANAVYVGAIPEDSELFEVAAVETAAAHFAIKAYEKAFAQYLPDEVSTQEEPRKGTMLSSLKSLFRK